MTIAAVTAGTVIDPTTFGNAVIDKLNGIVAGTTSGTTTAGGDLTIAFGVTFTSTPVVVATVQVVSSTQYSCHLPASASTTQQTVRVTTNDAVANAVAVTVRWIAFGTLA